MTDSRTHRITIQPVTNGAAWPDENMPLHTPEPEHRSGWAIAVAAVAVMALVLPLLAVGLNWLLAEGLAIYWRMGE